jgi:hypothetical protein
MDHILYYGYCKPVGWPSLSHATNHHPLFGGHHIPLKDVKRGWSGLPNCRGPSPKGNLVVSVNMAKKYSKKIAFKQHAFLPPQKMEPA